ncbi:MULTISPECIES: hypothetical protein [Streptomyces]|uniref:hypothetical protein n=1 Tax=Streptomyces TaxID=1883 RepID=UPI0022512B13|nr:hypothetical protein [Streptomyces virginiae]MCX5270558.1 hypothetical protein [Streptomyces virginiae]WST21788.1 hypothetical protein OG264_09955 [Streptomyces xanthophaeus]WST63225.1 hypothetical protein OG605_28405 [Streptomyces xanthophaeus]
MAFSPLAFIAAILFLMTARATALRWVLWRRGFGSAAAEPFCMASAGTVQE